MLASLTDKSPAPITITATTLLVIIAVLIRRSCSRPNAGSCASGQGLLTLGYHTSGWMETSSAPPVGTALTAFLQLPPDPAQ